MKQSLEYNTIADSIKKCGEEAASEFGLPPESVDFVAFWVQTWPNSACGFPGMAMQSFWDAPTFVFASNDGRNVAVFHKGKFAYAFEWVNEKFLSAMRERQLPGAMGDWQSLGTPHSPPSNKLRP